VYEALKQEEGIHALSIQALTHEEWDQKKKGAKSVHEKNN
jgi:acid stress-induced BolA-like protein IbaG/YrbA